MPAVDDQATLAQVTRTSQIITGSLTAGPLIFLAIVGLLRSGGNLPQPIVLAPLSLTYVAVAIAVLALGASVLVPKLITASERRKVADGTWIYPTRNLGGSSAPPPGAISDVGKLAVVFQKQHIIAAAQIEGVAFFATIAYFLERNPLALGLALVLIGAVALLIPTRARVERWIDHQLEQINQVRQLGGGGRAF
jgi:hypothetical protein